MNDPDYYHRVFLAGVIALPSMIVSFGEWLLTLIIISVFLIVCFFDSLMRRYLKFNVFLGLVLAINIIGVSTPFILLTFGQGIHDIVVILWFLLGISLGVVERSCYAKLRKKKDIP
jgi:uncharacterized membrane protein YjjP (DUF1212 family)